MEVDACALVSKLRYISTNRQASTDMSSHLVVHIGNDSIAFCEVEQREWPLPIDAHDRTFSHSIWVGSYPGDVPIECDCGSACYGGEGEEGNEQTLQ
jgi:hypothetical protein